MYVELVEFNLEEQTAEGFFSKNDLDQEDVLDFELEFDYFFEIKEYGDNVTEPRTAETTLEITELQIKSDGNLLGRNQNKELYNLVEDALIDKLEYYVW